MSLGSPIHEWREIPANQAEGWNNRLLGTEASVYQFPFWNEAYRQLRFRPVYLCYGPSEAPLAYTCVLSLGLPGLRIGLIQRGPVSLGSDGRLGPDVFRSLIHWSRRKGYIFLRIDPANPDVADRASAAGRALQRDLFPFLYPPRESFLVNQVSDDEATLSTFQPTARRQIKAAEQFGYDIRISDTAEELTRAWPLFHMTAQRKGFRINRSLSFWRKTFELGRLHGCVWICTAYLQGKPIQSILLVHDGTTTDYIYGGMDLEALGGNPSPSCLLHWRGMRHGYQLGCTHYDLGVPGPPKLRIFKNKFRPTPHTWPLPLTFATNRIIAPIWSMVVLRGVVLLWPRLKRLLVPSA